MRRKAGASDAKQQEVQDQQKGKRGRCKEPQEPAPAEQPKKPSLPAAAAAAVAAVVHPERRHKAEGADAGETKRQQHQQPAKPPSGSDSDSDAGQGGRRPGHRRHSHDEPHTEGEQVGEERQAAAAQQQAQQQQQQQAQQQREEEEVDDRPRVLAYSDSDSGVLVHLLPALVCAVNHLAACPACFSPVLAVAGLLRRALMPGHTALPIHADATLLASPPLPRCTAPYPQMWSPTSSGLSGM